MKEQSPHDINRPAKHNINAELAKKSHGKAATIAAACLCVAFAAVIIVIINSGIIQSDSGPPQTMQTTATYAAAEYDLTSGTEPDAESRQAAGETAAEYVAEPQLATELLPDEAQPPSMSPFIDIPHGTLAIEHTIFINDNFPGRISFSYRELETAQWILGQLHAMGYTNEHVRMQEFSTDAAQLRPRQNPLHSFAVNPQNIRGYSQNVILTIPGQSEQKIVVGAHYDSYPYPGASDNAVSVGVLLEAAARLRYLDNYYTIEFVFFGAEEAWWIGAYYYLYRLSAVARDRIVLMINVDILLDGDTLIYSAGHGTNRNAPDTNLITAQIGMIAEMLNAQHNAGLNAVPRGISINADHVPFFDAGITVMFLFGADYDTPGGRFFNNRLFHTPRDCIHYINANFPGRTQRNIRVFSMFLEEVLLMR